MRNTIQVRVSFDEKGEKIEILFDYLPRPGDFIYYNDRKYLVDRIVFSINQSKIGLAGVPSVFAHPLS